MLRYGHSTYSFRSTLVDTLMIYHIGIDWGAHREENVRSLDLCSTLWTLVHWHKNQKTQSKIFNWSMWKGWTSCFRWGSGCLVITWSHSSLAGQWKRLASWGLLVISHSTVNSPGLWRKKECADSPPHFQNCAHLSLDQNRLPDCACSAKQNRSTQIWTHSSPWHFGFHQHEQFDMRLMRGSVGHIILG